MTELHVDALTQSNKTKLCRPRLSVCVVAL